MNSGQNTQNTIPSEGEIGGVNIAQKDKKNLETITKEIDKNMESKDQFATVEMFRDLAVKLENQMTTFQQDSSSKMTTFQQDINSQMTAFKEQIGSQITAFKQEMSSQMTAFKEEIRSTLKEEIRSAFEEQSKSMKEQKQYDNNKRLSMTVNSLQNIPNDSLQLLEQYENACLNNQLGQQHQSLNQIESLHQSVPALREKVFKENPLKKEIVEKYEIKLSKGEIVELTEYPSTFLIKHSESLDEEKLFGLMLHVEKLLKEKKFKFNAQQNAE